ncbi:hypothetical protein FHP25_04365 [Vineibacter terrae]|uniref:Uncharacterized protein n=1 Tax=Vineibacter terrae TaxID=2586908 RepID=A0A5C8PSK9_9HYPH|nr:hypothetical protein [Vineibacter terrae]TXL80276.1 hypothetical protein FHP25_04365 [Vineibacter terrae]
MTTVALPCRHLDIARRGFALIAPSAMPISDAAGALGRTGEFPFAIFPIFAQADCPVHPGIGRLNGDGLARDPGLRRSYLEH